MKFTNYSDWTGNWEPCFYLRKNKTVLNYIKKKVVNDGSGHNKNRRMDIIKI